LLPWSYAARRRELLELPLLLVRFIERTLVLREDAARLLLRSELPDALLRVRELLPVLRAEVLLRLPEAAVRRDDELLRLRLLLLCCAVSRLMILLKLLRWPLAVRSCTSSARLFSSNFSKNSSQAISSSEFSPLYPGKSSRRIPGSSPFAVRFTAEGRALRSSAHCLISS
jgi:hypothetical protein